MSERQREGERVGLRERGRVCERVRVRERERRERDRQTDRQRGREKERERVYASLSLKKGERWKGTVRVRV